VVSLNNGGLEKQSTREVMVGGVLRSVPTRIRIRGHPSGHLSIKELFPGLVLPPKDRRCDHGSGPGEETSGGALRSVRRGLTYFLIIVCF
jgi:hypothetical protein